MPSRIARSDFESITESSSSLDYNPRGRIQGSIFAGDGDPYLRISKDTGEDMIRDGDESLGPDVALKNKIDEWRAHVRDYATGAGFRKASRGLVDPRMFALHLSRIALKHAHQYGSRSLFKIAKQLRWAASQSRQAAETALKNISGDDSEEQETVGMTQIEKPGVPPVIPHWETQRGDPEVAPEENSVQPGSMRQTLPDRSWSAEKTGSRRRRANEESNSDLVQYALDFLEDYRSTNSLADDTELLEKLNDSEVFESWLVDLDNRGVLADPPDLDEAWSRALDEMTSSLPNSNEELHPDITTSKKPIEDPKIQEFMAPGGDWFNSVLDTNTHPGLDRYIRNKMSSKKDYGWANRFTEDDYQSSMDHIVRRARSEDRDEEESMDGDSGKIMKVVDQCLDHFAGEMVPSEVSPDHVRQFVERDFPGIPWKKVYEAIEEISDPKKRHEKERTNEEYRASRPVKVVPSRSQVNSCHYVSAFDTMETSPHRKYAHLQGHREICACCTGTGQEGAGACSRCQGRGRHGLDPNDPQVAAKARVIDRVGSLLLVEVNPQQLAPKGRQLLSQVTRTRVASGSRVRYTHSLELMQFLTGYDVPFKMVGYQHPNYKTN